MSRSEHRLAGSVFTKVVGHRSARASREAKGGRLRRRARNLLHRLLSSTPNFTLAEAGWSATRVTPQTRGGAAGPEIEHRRRQGMTKAFASIYAAIAYAAFLASYLYGIGFVGNLVVPKTIDSGSHLGIAESLTVNLILLSVFAVQHSVMARPGFKQKWTRIVPEHVERSTYVLLSSLLLLLLYWQWRPMNDVIWSVEEPAGRVVLWAFFWFGWVITLLSSFMINHFDLFGLRQVYLYVRGQEYEPVPFKAAGLYRYVRHPLMLGFIIAFWATPHMTTGHLLFAIATTAYIAIAIHFEESDLRRFLGEQYERYAARVPMLLPKFGKRFT